MSTWRGLAYGLAILLAGCSSAEPFGSNFQPSAVEPTRKGSGDPPGPKFDQAAFDAMVAEADRRLAPCKAVWSLTGTPHVIDVRCPEGETFKPRR